MFVKLRLEDLAGARGFLRLSLELVARRRQFLDQAFLRARQRGALLD